MRQASGEAGALAEADLVPHPGHGERQGARLDPGKLPGRERMRVPAERLSGKHLPAPQLGGPGRLRRGDDGPGAAHGTLPQRAGIFRAGDPDARLGRDIEQPGDRQAERVTHSGQRGEVRVGASLLQGDQDALAHPGPGGEPVEGPAAFRAQGGQGARQCGAEVVARHGPSPDKTLRSVY